VNYSQHKSNLGENQRPRSRRILATHQ